MWWAGSKALDVYLGSRAVAVCEQDQLLLKQRIEGVSEAMCALKAWSDEATPKRANVWLGGGLCRPMLMPPVPGLKSEAEWRQAATAMASTQLGIEEPCEVWVEKAPADRARVVAVVPKTVLQAIEAWAQEGQLRVSKIAPWWSEALRSVLEARADAAAVAVQDCDSLTFFTGEAGRFRSVAVYTPVWDEATARATLTRAMMGTALPPEQEEVVSLRFDGAVTQPMSLALGPIAERHA